MQLDVCVEGWRNDDDLVLDTPGLPSLAQLTLVWNNGRSTSVSMHASAFAGMVLTSVPARIPLKC